MTARRWEDGALALLPSVVVLFVIQIVFALLSSRRRLFRPLISRGAGRGAFRGTLPLAAPASGLSLAKATDETKREHLKKIMNPNTTKQTEEKARVRSEYEGTGKQRKWNLFIGEEPYGFVHARTEREALDRVAAFKRPFRAVLALDQD